MKVVAVIPCYNEERTVAEVIRATKPFVDDVVVVIDGGRDRSAEAARAAGACVVEHCVNRGLGASLGTGIRAARLLDADVIVTLDADGQMRADEIPLFVKKIEEGFDAIIGSRMIEFKGNMPLLRRLYQRVGNLLTYMLFGLWVTDSQSGFRGFSAAGADKLEIRTDRMEVSSEIISEIRRKQLKWTEVPITAIYTDYSLGKGQSFSVGVKTAWKLILHRLKS